MLTYTSSSASSMYGTAKLLLMKFQTGTTSWIREFSSSVTSSVPKMGLDFITMPPDVQATSPSGPPH